MNSSDSSANTGYIIVISCIAALGGFLFGFDSGVINGTIDGLQTAFESDTVENYEFGWKLTLADNRVRWNGAAFFLDWSDQQITLFDPPIYGIVAFTANLAGSELKGVETDFTALLTDTLTLQGAMTFLDGEITELPGTGAEGLRPVGSDLSRVPDFNATLNLRGEFEMRGTPSFWTLGVSHTGDMIQGLSATNSLDLDAYTLVNASVGMNYENVQLRLIASNITDERPELGKVDNGSLVRIRSTRPRALTLRATFDF